MRPNRGATSSPDHSVVGVMCPGNQYQKAGEEHVDRVVTRMDDDHLVDIADKVKRLQSLRGITKYPTAQQCYDQRVLWITWQYGLATYLHAGHSCLARTMSTQDQCHLSRFALIVRSLDE